MVTHIAINMKHQFAQYLRGTLSVHLKIELFTGQTVQVKNEHLLSTYSSSRKNKEPRKDVLAKKNILLYRLIEHNGQGH